MLLAVLPSDPVTGHDDACNAGAYQYLVGQPKTKIPPKPPGAIWRVVSSKEMITMDYIGARLNIVWDAGSKRVIKVSCG
jgi:hypothetical protein